MQHFNDGNDMTCDVLLIDTLSTLRVARGLISPAPVVAQMTGFLEQAEIPYEILFAIPQDDGSIDLLQENQVVSNRFDTVLKEIAPRTVVFYHDPELVHLMFAVYREARKIIPDALFCAGGILSSALPHYYLEKGFDYIIGQDVYQSLISIIQHIKEAKMPDRGLFSISQPYQDLDYFPFIAQKYFTTIKPQWSFPRGHIERFGLITGSAGCTSGCVHCPNSSYWGTTWRTMSAERIFNEIKFQNELLKVDTFYFGDINFLPNAAIQNDVIIPHPKALERITQLDKLLDEHEYATKFISTIRPDTISLMADYSPEVLDIFLRRFAACFLGIESFSEEVLAGLKAPITKKNIRRAVKLLEQRGIIIVASFLVGSPWETYETLRETEQFILNELPPSAIPLLNIMTPFPGTRFYDSLKSKGLLLERDVGLFNGQRLVFKHPVFKEEELEIRIQEFYYQFFRERYSG
ncbi:MAG: radical SAM protein [Proteobacteria bacterium]|nr:radical SAM protein [Pseudomonadota bacterium]